MEATCYSETSVDLNGLHGVILQKIKLFKFMLSSRAVNRLNWFKMTIASGAICVSITSDRLTDIPRRLYYYPGTCLEGLWRTANKPRVCGRESNQESSKYDARELIIRRNSTEGWNFFPYGRWKFEVFTAVWVIIFWDITPCRLLEAYRNISERLLILTATHPRKYCGSV
jgi:hypothetical protein